MALCQLTRNIFYKLFLDFVSCEKMHCSKKCKQFHVDTFRNVKKSCFLASKKKKKKNYVNLGQSKSNIVNKIKIFKWKAKVNYLRFFSLIAPCIIHFIWFVLLMVDSVTPQRVMHGNTVWNYINWNKSGYFSHNNS